MYYLLGVAAANAVIRIINFTPGRFSIDRPPVGVLQRSWQVEAPGRSRASRRRTSCNRVPAPANVFGLRLVRVTENLFKFHTGFCFNINS